MVNYENTVLEAAREAEDGIVSLLRTQEQEKFLVESVVASKRSVDLSMIQYREGFTDYQRVLDTQRFLTNQQDIQTAVSGNVSLSLVSIYKALGGGWLTVEEREADEAARAAAEEQEVETTRSFLLGSPGAAGV